MTRDFQAMVTRSLENGQELSHICKVGTTSGENLTISSWSVLPHWLNLSSRFINNLFAPKRCESDNTACRVTAMGCTSLFATYWMCLSGLHFSTASGEISQGLLPCSFATSCLRFAQHYPPWLVKWFCDFFGTGRHSDAWYTISYGLEDSKTGGTLFWVKPITLHRWSECRSCKYPFRTTWLTGFMTAFSR